MIETKQQLPWFYGTQEWAAYSHAYNATSNVPSNCSSSGNLVVDLDGEMQRRIRKGHWAQIKKMQKSCSIVYDTDGEHLDVLQGLHHLDSGRITRSQETWDLMRSWQPAGYGLVVVAVRDHLPIGAAYFIRYTAGGYYASAARDPNLAPNESPAHLIVWSAMNWLRERGYRWLDFGPLDESSSKLANIAAFKRRFGAAVRVWPYES